ncbi:MAG: DUF4159 domain-containing protein [Candidatus Obscuribacterales bacterium]|nr:DUF4159 domain-containing protein [Steroidobacteraceae bacterium]
MYYPCLTGHQDMRRLKFTLLGLISVLVTVLVCAQSNFGWYRGRPIVQNEPPETEFIAARWHFGTNGAVDHMGWAHNYPNSDQNLNEFLDRATRVNVEIGSYRIVELGSEEVFDYPFAYVSEPGEMELTEQEVRNLREFINRGGFVLVDDFDGPWQFEQLRSQIRRAFPDRAFVPLSIDHRVFHAQFDLDDLQGMAEYVSGERIVYFGLFDDAGRLAILAGHNNDLANFWEWYNEPSRPLKPGADAFRLGANAVIYSMTH